MDMSQNSKDAKYGRWLRRLLHVPSLTSFEWEPGNRYGGHTCPLYNTLSYTWGRFALRDHEQPQVKALPIHFQGRRSWKVPRINPEHFTVSEFLAVVQLAVQVNELEEADVEFLWLDVACIDQDHAKTKLSEINRQALIFQNAHTSCVWMSHVSGDTLLSIVDHLTRLDSPYPYPMPPGKPINHRDEIKEPRIKWLEVWIPTLQDIVKTILPDHDLERSRTRPSAPWFSSLWTLQEAYLRPNACILPRDCRNLLRIKHTERQRMPRLRSLTRNLGWAAKLLEESLALGIGPHHVIRDILNSVHEAGLLEMLKASPFSILTASSRRQTSNPCDRVYGIMQVFGFQFPLQHKGRPYRLPELQAMLSEKVLHEFPVESQLFVHTEQQAAGTKWMMSTSGSIPSWAGSLTLFSRAFRGGRSRPHPADPLPLCKLSVTHGSAHFQGRLCSLQDLILPFELIDTARMFDHMPEFSSAKSSASNVAVAFDMVPSGLAGSSRLQIPGLPGFVFAATGCDPEDTHRILTALTKSDTQRDLKMLLIGSCLDPLTVSYYREDGGGYHTFTKAWRREHDEWFIGLILRRRSSWCLADGHSVSSVDPFLQYYERIGVCKWVRWDRFPEDVDDKDFFVRYQDLTDDMKDVLSGTGEKWSTEEGYWG